MNEWKEKMPGLVLCLLIALPCWMLGKWIPVIGGPVFAILAGMVLTQLLRDKTRVAPGVGLRRVGHCGDGAGDRRGRRRNRAGDLGHFPL